MILIINNETIEFSFKNRIKKTFLDASFRISNQARRGPQVVATNLLKELGMRQDIHWDRCFRDIPKNNSINIMWVVSDLGDLQWAIENKHKVCAKELWAGPNLVVVPQEAKEILNSNEIDKIIVPCEWVKEVYERESRGLIGKINIWPVGVDINFWTPSDPIIKNKENENTNILVYNKNQDDICNKIIPILKNHGNVKTIQYGEYSINQYKQALNDATFMVWLSMAESQGLALLEALSMNVPVLVWDSDYWFYYSMELKKEFVCRTSSSSPYFSSKCGLKFKSLEDFEIKLIELIDKTKKLEFKPRDYLFDNNLIIGGSLTNLDITK